MKTVFLGLILFWVVSAQLADSVLPESVKVEQQHQTGWVGKLDPADIKRRAAQGNDAEAMFTLGMFYEYGQHAEHDDVKSFDMYSKAAALGHPKAQHNVAYMYRYGQKPAEKSLSKAVETWEKSAGQGFSLSQRYLSILLLRGYDNVAPDLVRGLDFMKKAADKGDVIAQYRFGKILLTGKYGEKIDRDLALKYLKKAVDQQYARAKSLYEEEMKK
jgi:TPR repeat protein